jgi:hypothetical protein
MPAWRSASTMLASGVDRGDHRYPTAYQVGGEVGQAIVVVLRPAILDRHVLALNIAAFPQAAQECGQKVSPADRRGAAQQPDDRHRRLLRPRRERPRNRRAAEKRDELVASC